MKRIELGDKDSQFLGAVGNGLASHKTGEQRFPMGSSALAHRVTHLPKYSRRCSMTIITRYSHLLATVASHRLARPMLRVIKG